MYVPNVTNFKIAGDFSLLLFMDTGFVKYMFKVMPAIEICKKQLKVGNTLPGYWLCSTSISIFIFLLC